MTEKFALKITSAIVIDGEIAKKDAIVTVDERTAKDLLRRGKAVLATEAEAAPAPAAEVADEPAPGGEDDPASDDAAPAPAAEAKPDKAVGKKK